MNGGLSVECRRNHVRTAVEMIPQLHRYILKCIRARPAHEDKISFFYEVSTLFPSAALRGWREVVDITGELMGRNVVSHYVRVLLIQSAAETLPMEFRAERLNLF